MAASGFKCHELYDNLPVKSHPHIFIYDGTRANYLPFTICTIVGGIVSYDYLPANVNMMALFSIDIPNIGASFANLPFQIYCITYPNTSSGFYAFYTCKINLHIHKLLSYDTRIDACKIKCKISRPLNIWRIVNNTIVTNCSYYMNCVFIV
jgi:hypothetical protein